MSNFRAYGLAQWAGSLSLCVLMGVSALGCKSSEEKAAEEAAKKYAEAAAKMQEAAKQMAEAQGKAAEGAAEAAEGAQEGAQGAAQGVKGAAAAMAGLAEAMKQMQAGTKAAAQATGAVEPVNFRELKALLPEEVGGMKRKSAKGEKAGITGMTVSQAEGRYEGDGGKRITIKIVDAGGMIGPMMMGAFGLAMVEIDREDDNGYERTSNVGGNKVWEKWNSKRERSEYKVLVGSRFVVDVDGRKVTMDDAKAASKAIDIGKLEALGKDAKPAGE